MRARLHTMHTHQRTERGQPLLFALTITAVIFLAEVAGGLLTGSLALLADAGHMLSDLMALALSLFALWMAGRPHTAVRTFGFHRAEILVALLNAVILIGVVAYIIWEAVQRFAAPAVVDAGLMLAIAGMGFAANVVAAAMLYRGSRENLNLRGAFLHVIGDALGSVGALVAGLIILATGWLRADPLISLLISLIVLASAWRLLNDALHVLLEAVPPGIETESVRRVLREVPGIEDVHDLHIWSVASGLVALSAHARVRENIPTAQILKAATEVLSSRFGIVHATIQPETESLHAALEAEGLSCCFDSYTSKTAQPKM